MADLNGEELKALLDAPTSTEDENAGDTAGAPPSGHEQTPPAPATETDPEQNAAPKGDEPKPADQPGDQDDELSQAERDVVARLAGDESETTPEGKPAPPAAKDGEGQEKPKAPDTFSADDEARLEPKTRKAFGSMRTEIKTLKHQLAELRPLAEEGTRFTSLIDKYQAREDLAQIGEDQHAGIIRIQAALVRAAAAQARGEQVSDADHELLLAVERGWAQELDSYGITRTPTAADPVPYDGLLDEAHKALIESGAYSEDDVRQLIAIKRAREKADKASKEQSSARPARSQPARPAAPTRAAALRTGAAPGASAPRPANDEASRYLALSRTVLSEAGIPRESQDLHVQTELLPIILKDLIAKRLPKHDPIGVWQGARPEVRHKLIQQAQAVYAQREAAPPVQERTAARPPAGPSRVQRPLVQRETRGARVPSRPDARPGDPVDAVVRRLDPQGRGVA